MAREQDERMGGGRKAKLSKWAPVVRELSHIRSGAEQRYRGKPNSFQIEQTTVYPPLLISVSQHDSFGVLLRHPPKLLLTPREAHKLAHQRAM